MDEVSNKTLATLLVVAIVISLAGTFFAMRGVSQITNIVTGAASTSGTAKVNISEVTEVTLTTATVDFGAGYRNASVVDVNSECNITSNQSTAPDCWVNLTNWEATQGIGPDPFVMENSGNNYVNVTINSSNASTFISGGVTGGTRRYQWMASDLDGGFAQGQNGCNVTLTNEASGWAEFDGTPQLLCTHMSPYDSEDEIYVDINLSIPAGPIGDKSAEVIFTFLKSAQ